MTKMDEKTSKDYVDNKLTDCVQKKSHYYLVDQLKECSTKEDQSKFKQIVNEQITSMDEMLTEFKEKFCMRTEMLEILRNFITSIE